jgi:cysteine desulfuration protein SufE
MKSSEQAKLIQEFSAISSWEEKYQKIIALGKGLAALPEELKTPDLLVKGCQSQVWLKADLDSQGHVQLRADSDALIVKGLIAILLKIYSGLTPTEILDTAPTFIADLGFENHLSPSRANGLQAMVKQIKFYGLAYRELLKSQSIKS